METVLVVGSTGNIGIAAIHGALLSGRNVLAIVRNQDSAEKIFEHVREGHERITTVQANVTSDQGVQSVVDRVIAGELPSFQHVHASVGGPYTAQSPLETTVKELREYMNHSFEANFFAYRAAIPYLLSQAPHSTSFTICTGAQGNIGERALPAITQGALFSLCRVGFRAYSETNLRFNEIYLAFRVEVDSEAEEHGVVKASRFGHLYNSILVGNVRSRRVLCENENDIENLRVASEQAA